MNSDIEFDADNVFPDGENQENRIVYVRPIAVNDLPEEVQEAAGDAAELYAVCSEEGEQLAVVSERRLAFLLAREHDYAPVSVH